MISRCRFARSRASSGYDSWIRCRGAPFATRSSFRFRPNTWKVWYRRPCVPATKGSGDALPASASIGRAATGTRWSSGCTTLTFRAHPSVRALGDFHSEANPDMASRKWGEALPDGWLPCPRGRNGRPGSVFRSASEGFRRARVQHEHDGLHGSPHRYLVPRPDFDDDVSADRQLRRRSRDDGVREDPADRIRRPRGVRGPQPSAEFARPFRIPEDL